MAQSARTFFAIDTRNAPETVVAMVAIAVLALLLDVVWKRARGPAPSPTDAG